MNASVQTVCGTGVAAPHAAEQRREEEQGQGGDDQQHREVEEVLRPQREAQQVKLARGQVEQHRLTVVPGQPRHDVEQAEQHDGCELRQLVEAALHFARIDLLRAGEHRRALRLVALCVSFHPRRFLSRFGAVRISQAVTALAKPESIQKKKNPAA